MQSILRNWSLIKFNKYNDPVFLLRFGKIINQSIDWSDILDKTSQLWTVVQTETK
jgi:hypothetical protein